MPQEDSIYYSDKLQTLQDIFGAKDVRLDGADLAVDGERYPIVDDVIVVLHPSQYPPHLKLRLSATARTVESQAPAFAADIQYTFGEEWKAFPDMLSEYERIFPMYFDLVDIADLRQSRVCDLGCGIGRWSYFLKHRCRELVLLDFSEAIFVARENLRDATNAVFFMGDLERLPFRDDFADLLFCLGVLHHLETDALRAVRALSRYAPRLLIYLYYAMDNRPAHFRAFLAAAMSLRAAVARVRDPLFRWGFAWTAALALYMPFILAGRVLRPVGLSRYVPLYEAYHWRGLTQIRQDAYDRFFTRIEQRHTRAQIMSLTDTFRRVTVSDRLPYWHFLCER
jgi:SAM-dependent methyltransferase